MRRWAQPLHNSPAEKHKTESLNLKTDAAESIQRTAGTPGQAQDGVSAREPLHRPGAWTASSAQAWLCPLTQDPCALG